MIELATGILPLRTGRGLNDRGSPLARAKKVKRERTAVALFAKVLLSPRAFPPGKLLRLQADHVFFVSLTRASPSHVGLDDDNLRGALKGTRDSIAARLGVNDGDRRQVRFFYAQRTRAAWGVEITIAMASRQELILRSNE